MSNFVIQAVGHVREKFAWERFAGVWEEMAGKQKKKKEVKRIRYSDGA